MGTDTARKPCGCPVCTCNRAMKMLDGALNAWVEHGTAQEGDFYYLLDEVQTFLNAPWWRRRKRTLEAALSAVKASTERTNELWAHTP